MDDEHGVKLSERMIPVPRSISAEARAAIARAIDGDGVPLNARHVMPAPDDIAGWSALKKAADAQYGEAVKQLAGTLRADIATVTAGPATVHVATPADTTNEHHAIIDLHGGALVLGGGETCRVGARLQADRHAVRCYGVDYRMPPEHPYPAALDDCIAAYRFALEHHDARDIVICGRSAGGNLAAAMLLRARDEALPMPGGLILLSPQVDLTESGDSFATNRTIDVVLPGSLMANNLLYAAGADLSDPLLSPLFGDLHGLPPTILQSGTRDLFLSNTVRMHRALRRAGVDADLHIFEAMPHGGFGGGTPEDRELETEIRAFVNRILRR